MGVLWWCGAIYFKIEVEYAIEIDGEMNDIHPEILEDELGRNMVYYNKSKRESIF